jgi:hypothetical protein
MIVNLQSQEQTRKIIVYDGFQDYNPNDPNNELYILTPNNNYSQNSSTNNKYGLLTIKITEERITVNIDSVKSLEFIIPPEGSWTAKEDFTVKFKNFTYSDEYDATCSFSESTNSWTIKKEDTEVVIDYYTGEVGLVDVFLLSYQESDITFLLNIKVTEETEDESWISRIGDFFSNLTITEYILFTTILMFLFFFRYIIRLVSEGRWSRLGLIASAVFLPAVILRIYF